MTGPTGTHRSFKLKSGTKVTYRQFTPKDAAICSRLVLGNFRGLIEGSQRAKEVQQAYGAENIARTARIRDYQVVELDGVVVGVMGFLPYTESMVEVSNLAIDSSAQRRGIGKLLVALGMAEKMAQGISHFCAYANARSKGIFERLGFQPSSTLPACIFGNDRTPMEVDAGDSLRQKLTDLLAELIQAEGQATKNRTAVSGNSPE